MSSLEFREAIPGDEAVLLPMMRVLAEQEPEVIPFNEPAVRAAFHQFLSLPAFGRIWFLYNVDHNRFLMTKWLKRDSK